MLTDAANIVDHALALIADREPIDEIPGLGPRTRANVSETISSKQRRLQAVVYHIPLLGAEELIRDHQGANGIDAGAATGIANHVGADFLQSGIGGRV